MGHGRSLFRVVTCDEVHRFPALRIPQQLPYSTVIITST